MNELSVSQILGFDILLMKNLKPVLLEVNSNPSMRIEHEQEVRDCCHQYHHSYPLCCTKFMFVSGGTGGF